VAAVPCVAAGFLHWRTARQGLLALLFKVHVCKVLE
jgi:hypothetical protein